MKQKIIDFLNRLCIAQEKTLEVLKRKQGLLVRPDKVALETLAPEENEILAELQEVLHCREEILAEARQGGLEVDSIEMLCQKLYPTQFAIRKIIETAQQRSREIRYIGMTNWTMTQKSLVHIAQILEIISTGGQGKTTYKPQNGTSGPDSAGGGFVDRVA